MKNSLHLLAIIGVAFGVGALALLVAGESVSIRWFFSIGMASTATGLVILAFNRWLWLVPHLQGWFVHRPHLAGTWNVELKSLWVDPDTGVMKGPIAGTATITQTHNEIYIHMKTDESIGELVEGNIVRKTDGAYQIVGVFLNKPKMSVRERSAIHHGAIMLDVLGPPTAPTGLKGSYWTDRRTCGEFGASPAGKRKTRPRFKT